MKELDSYEIIITTLDAYIELHNPSLTTDELAVVFEHLAEWYNDSIKLKQINEIL